MQISLKPTIASEKTTPTVARMVIAFAQYAKPDASGGRCEHATRATKTRRGERRGHTIRKLLRFVYAIVAGRALRVIRDASCINDFLFLGVARLGERVAARAQIDSAYFACFFFSLGLIARRFLPASLSLSRAPRTVKSSNRFRFHEYAPQHNKMSSSIKLIHVIESGKCADSLAAAAGLVD